MFSFVMGLLISGLIGITVSAILQMGWESQPETPYPECTGDPACCPENEGYGCGCSFRCLNEVIGERG